MARARGAPNRANVKVRGFRELAQGNEQLFENILEAVSVRFMGVAERVASESRSKVPSVSGTLAASITAKKIKRKTGRGGKAVMGKKSVPYAGWIEFGGSKPHSRPFMPDGRYLMPTAIAHHGAALSEATLAADKEIGAMRWPTPK